MNDSAKKSVPAELTDHAVAILTIIKAIPPGHVATYGEIATRAGLPRRARLVGHVLRKTPATPTIPWYRVLRADGHLAFPIGTREFREQVRHLSAEGVAVVSGHVNLVQFGWGRNLDAVLWGPEMPSTPKKQRLKKRGR